MKISEVYEKYEVPPNLQQHMIRVASVGAWIADHWSTHDLNKVPIVQALLLHDMGNIIKFDFSLPHLLGEESKNVEHWKAVQQRFKEKYGDEHVATSEIAKEVGLSPLGFEYLKAVGSSHLKDAVRIGDFNKKICCYSDFRVDPFGIVMVNKRFDDIVARYRGRDHELGNIEETERRRGYCLELEKQLQEYVKEDLQKLDNEMLSSYYQEVTETQFP